jgi:hypothetical protein
MKEHAIAKPVADTRPIGERLLLRLHEAFADDKHKDR